MMADWWQNEKDHAMKPPANRGVLPDIILERTPHEPLYRQIMRQITGAIRSGTLGPGVRLPSTRSLSRLLGVSRNIVIVAYENLAADGLIRSEPGSGAWVEAAGPVSLPPMASVLSAAMYPEHLPCLMTRTAI